MPCGKPLTRSVHWLYSHSYWLARLALSHPIALSIPPDKHRLTSPTTIPYKNWITAYHALPWDLLFRTIIIRFFVKQSNCNCTIVVLFPWLYYCSIYLLITFIISIQNPLKGLKWPWIRGLKKSSCLQSNPKDKYIHAHSTHISNTNIHRHHKTSQF